MVLDEILQCRKQMKSLGAFSSGSILLETKLFFEHFPSSATWTKVTDYENGVLVSARYGGEEFFCGITNKEYEALKDSGMMPVKRECKLLPLQYLELSINEDCKILVKAGDDGYVVDVYGKNPDVPVAGTWANYSELGGEQ